MMCGECDACGVCCMVVLRVMCCCVLCLFRVVWRGVTMSPDAHYTALSHARRGEVRQCYVLVQVQVQVLGGHVRLCLVMGGYMRCDDAWICFALFGVVRVCDRFG